MGYVINEYEVLREFTVQTRTRQQVVREHHAFVTQVAITAPVQITTAETANITFLWQQFDLGEEQHLDDPTNQTPFEVEVADQQVQVAVGETLEFSSAEPGEYTIRTVNQGVGNAEEKVVVVSA